MVCKKCGKEFTEKYSIYANGNFCSKQCAKKFAAIQNKGKTKSAKCKICGEEIIVGLCSNSNNVYCDICRKRKKYKRNTKGKCKICGSDIKCQRKDICKKYRVFPTLIKYLGFDKNKIGTSNVYEEYERIVNIIEHDYFKLFLSLPDIQQKYGFKDFGTLGNFIKKSLGIKLRNSSESSELSWKNGKQQIRTTIEYKQGYYTTWNNKEVFYRSSYELDYCKELDEKKINYEMETKRFWYWDSVKQKQRVAIPDFYLPETNEIIEIKSDWTYDEQNMKDKFKSYKEHGYKPKLILEHEIVEI